MRNNYKLLHVIALVSIYFCVGFSQLNAQTVPFTMSAVGEFPETPCVSAAIQFTSSISCNDVQTDVAVLEGERGAGLFAINCELTSNINTLGINMYPYPSVSQTKIKFIHTAHPTKTFQVTVVKVDGLKRISCGESGYHLFIGKSIEVNRLQTVTIS